jgi:diguanylate cyclase (GGDEF)-like protein
MSPSVRHRTLATVTPPPLALALTYLTLFSIVLTVALNARAPWAWTWLALSAVFVLWRGVYAVLSRGQSLERQMVRIVLGSAPLFVMFGPGNVACIAYGDTALTLVSLTGTLGIIAGLSSRWAAMPRAAITTITLTAIPPIAMLLMRGGLEMMAGVMLTLTTLSSVAFTLQNHGYLLSAAHAEEELSRLAHTDPLTGLANRIELHRLLERACAQLQPNEADSQLAVLCIDLDGFKSINDAYGHAAGDALLRRVAQLLQECLPAKSTIARMGGDEFVVLLPGADEVSARRTADQLISGLSQEQALPGRQIVQIGCSIGISLAPMQSVNPEMLLARADQALYTSKHRGKGQARIWHAL